MITAQAIGDRLLATTLGIKIAQSRLQWAEVPVSNGAIIMIAALCNTPGLVVLYCAVMKAFGAWCERLIERQLAG